MTNPHLDHPAGTARIRQELLAKKRLAALSGPAPEEPDPPPEPVEIHIGPAARIPVLDRLVPEWLRRARLNPGRSGALALVAVAALVALVTVLLWPGGVAAEPAPVVSAPAAQQQKPAQLVVSVVGRVGKPGLVSLPEGARIADAVQAAGGLLPDADPVTVNLARKVGDGEQIVVGLPAPAADPGQGEGVKVSLNAATVQQLDGLPGVGQVTAQRIVQWRTKHGRFSSVDQLREVDGIGSSRLAKLRELVTL